MMHERFLDGLQHYWVLSVFKLNLEVTVSGGCVDLKYNISDFLSEVETMAGPVLAWLYSTLH